MRQLVYFSTAASQQTPLIIEQILSTSRAHNDRDGITGLLVAGGNRYLQLIEGKSRAIGALYRRILADHRHVSVCKMIDRTVREPIFAEWSMAFVEEPQLDRFETFPEIVAATASMLYDLPLRRRVRCFGEMFTAPPVAPGA